MTNFIGWFLGVALILIGLILMVQAFLSGLILAIIGLSLIPKIRNLLVQKTNIIAGQDAKKLIYFVLWVLFVVSLVYTSGKHTQELEEAKVKAEQERRIKLEKQRKENLAKLMREKEERSRFFLANKDTIIKDIKILHEQKKYSEAIKKINLYVQTKDNELMELKKNTESILKKIKNEKREKEVLSELKVLPASDIDKNYKLYKELVGMYPKNDKYQKKMKHYQDKVIERDAKIAAEKIFYGEMPIRSAWDGSYYEVERYLKSVANDPSSIDIENCSKPYKSDDGWIVLCKYRGRNAFGGMILKHNWFIIRQNQVVGVAEPDRFRVK